MNDLNLWYQNEFKDGGCIYQLDASGEMSFELGPFFVRGAEKATQLWMMLNGIDVLKQGLSNSEGLVHEAIDVMVAAQAYLMPMSPTWKKIEAFRHAHN